jgi:hypothetical protein
VSADFLKELGQVRKTEKPQTQSFLAHPAEIEEMGVPRMIR